MKHFLITLFALVLSLPAMTQHGYQFSSGQHTWTDLTNFTEQFTGDSEVPVLLPFQFPFDGLTTDTVFLHEDGLVLKIGARIAYLVPFIRENAETGRVCRYRTEKDNAVFDFLYPDLPTMRTRITLQADGGFSYSYHHSDLEFESEPVFVGFEVVELSGKTGFTTEEIQMAMRLQGAPLAPTLADSENYHGLDAIPAPGSVYNFLPVREESPAGSFSYHLANSGETITLSSPLPLRFKILDDKGEMLREGVTSITPEMVNITSALRFFVLQLEFGNNYRVIKYAR